MSNVLFKNFSQSTLAAPITNVATTLAVQAGDGALFPAISGGNWFWAILVNASNQYEIIKVTGRTGDTFTTIVRNQEGTTGPLAGYSAGDRIVHWITAQGLADLLAEASVLSTYTTKGDIVVASAAAAVSRLGIGSDGQAFVADSNQTLGAKWGAPVLRSHLAGLTLSTAGGSGTMSIAAGVAADSTNVAMMTGAATSKTTSSWALGAAAGGLDTGAIANSTWYHFFEIMRVDTGVVDHLFSLSPTSPTLPTNYTLFRRIGAGLTDGSAHWTAFSQSGDEFLWSTALQDYNATTAATAASVTCTVPTGAVVTVRGRASLTTGGGGGAAVLWSSLAESDQSPSAGIYATLSLSGATSTTSGEVLVRTNASAQVRVRSSNTNGTAYLYTFGWYDRRGRDA